MLKQICASRVTENIFISIGCAKLHGSNVVFTAAEFACNDTFRRSRQNSYLYVHSSSAIYRHFAYGSGSQPGRREKISRGARALTCSTLQHGKFLNGNVYLPKFTPMLILRRYTLFGLVPAEMEVGVTLVVIKLFLKIMQRPPTNFLNGSRSS